MMSSQALSERACSLCKSRKVKCSRSLPTCRQCEKSGAACDYPDHFQVRFRDNTKSASIRAVQQWRSRAKKTASPESFVSPESSGSSIQHVICPPVEVLARQRFLYDFADTDTSPFSHHLQMIVLKWATTPQGTERRTGLDYALDAVALANFSRRHKDLSATPLAIETHFRAAKRMREDLQCPKEELSYQNALATVLLGLFQSIYHEEYMIGYWVYHFCGTVHILLQLKGNSPEKEHLTRLVTMQALFASLRMGYLIRLPRQVHSWLRQGATLHTPVTRLAYQALDICLKYGWFNEDTCCPIPPYVPSSDLARALVFEQRYQALDTELRQNLPYTTFNLKPEYYPQWFHKISMHGGCPTTTHTYPNMLAAATWTSYRIIRLKLLCWLLKFPSADSIPLETRLDFLETALQLARETAQSFYYCMSQTGAGRPSPSSFNDVPSSAGYTLHMQFLALRDCIVSVPVVEAEVGWLTIDWLERTVEIFSERLGISEALVWPDGDFAAKSRMLRKLKFEESVGEVVEEIE